MDTQTKAWKQEAERLWAAPELDWRGATQLAAEMTRSETIGLHAAAAQALPSLRAAMAKGADRHTREVARRRFAAIRNALHSLDAPRFGRRGSAEVLTPEERHRRMLGLPSGRRLFAPEIREAYKRAAKTMHPDAGGSARAFLELSAARDALLGK
jgi:hypothetical protein